MGVSKLLGFRVADGEELWNIFFHLAHVNLPSEVFSKGQCEENNEKFSEILSQFPTTSTFVTIFPNARDRRKMLWIGPLILCIFLALKSPPVWETYSIDQHFVTHEQGNNYICYAQEDFPTGDTPENPFDSTWHLLEDQIILLQVHSLHSDIREKGLGRYSHWGGGLYFSATDNSDPRTNGHAYSLKRPRLSWSRIVWCILALGCALVMAVHLPAKRTLRRVLFSCFVFSSVLMISRGGSSPERNKG